LDYFQEGPSPIGLYVVPGFLIIGVDGEIEVPERDYNDMRALEANPKHAGRRMS